MDGIALGVLFGGIMLKKQCDKSPMFWEESLDRCEILA